MDQTTKVETSQHSFGSVREKPPSLSSHNESKNGSEKTLVEGGVLSTKTFVVVVSFIQGLFSISHLAIFFYQKERLNLEPDFIQIMAGVLQIPWCIKPVFGFLFDKIVY